MAGSLKASKASQWDAAKRRDGEQHRHADGEGQAEADRAPQRGRVVVGAVDGHVARHGRAHATQRHQDQQLADGEGLGVGADVGRAELAGQQDRQRRTGTPG